MSQRIRESTNQQVVTIAHAAEQVLSARGGSHTRARFNIQTTGAIAEVGTTTTGLPRASVGVAQTSRHARTSLPPDVDKPKRQSKNGTGEVTSKLDWS